MPVRSIMIMILLHSVALSGLSGVNGYTDTKQRVQDSGGLLFGAGRTVGEDKSMVKSFRCRCMIDTFETHGLEFRIVSARLVRPSEYICT